VEVLKESVGDLEPYEVLCSADKSLINIGTELFCLEGIFDPGTNWESMVVYPFYPGCGMSARIIKIGKEVKGFKVGDRVGFPGCPHKQYFRAKPKELHIIPDGITSEESTWVSLALTTQLGVRAAKLELGESVGVIGLGILGQLTVQYLKIFAPRRIIAIDKSKVRLEMAKTHGATHILLGELKIVKKELEKITNNKMLDVVFDITGNPEVLASSIQFLRTLGRVILLGDTPTPSKQYLGPYMVRKAISIIGVHGYVKPKKASVFNPWSSDTMRDLFYEYIIQGKMVVKDLITKRCSPINAKEVYKSLVDDRYNDVGIIFDWNSL
jgi:threonine dehydrogenase-like Zn-dependent dehydrogenase